jgi:hypothetical protein
MAQKIETPEQLDAYLQGLAKTGSEHAEQQAFFAWLNFMQYHGVHPMARMAYAVPNGGKRDMITASRLKAEGVKPGVPDVCYPVPLHGFHSLYLEFKAKGGTVAGDQMDWHLSLRACGHAVCVVWGWRAARRCFEDYTRNTLQTEYPYEES